MSRTLATTYPVLSAMLLLSAACGDRHDWDECEASVAPECDISQVECVSVYSEHVACVRGAEAEPPEVELLSETELISRLSGDRSVSASDRCLSVVGLEYLERSRSWRAGAQDGPTAAYSLVEEKVLVSDPDDSRAILRAVAIAHIDAEVGGLMNVVQEASTLDEGFARRSRLLGEAIFIGDAAWWKIEPMSDGDFHEFIAENIYFGDEIADLMWLARERSAGLGLLLSYFDFYGAQFVLEQWQEGPLEPLATGPGGLRSADIILNRPPSGSETSFSAIPSVPGYSTVWSSSLGSLAVHAHLTRADPPAEEETFTLDSERIVTLAEITSGDQATCLYDAANDAVAVVWEVVVDDLQSLPYPLDYSGLATVKRSLRPDRVLIVAAEDLEVRDQIFAEIE